MKKILAFSLVLAVLIGLFPTALAEGNTAEGMTAHGAELCAYVGEGNLLRAVGEREPLVQERVRAVVYASDTALVYEVADEFCVDTDREGVLTALDVAADVPQPTAIASVSIGSVWSKEDGLVFYAPHDNPSALMQYDPALGTSEPACNAGAPITRLRLSADGLLVATESAERLYIPVLHSLADPIYPAQRATVEVGDRFEALLDASGVLSTRLRGNAQTNTVAQGVTAMAVEGPIVYFLQAIDGQTHLMAHNITSGAGASDMCAFGEPMLNELAVGDGFIFAVGESFVVYRYALLTGECEPFTMLNKAEVYQPVLKAFDGLLLIYDAAREVDQNFVKAFEVGAPASQEDGIVQPDLDAAAPESAPAPEEDAEEPENDGSGIEDEPADFEDPVDKKEREAREKAAREAARKAREEAAKKEAPEYATLSNGSRGEAVVRLQQRLKELGYLSGAVDGVYGKSTQRAVTYLQGDMGYTETGTAGVKFQQAVFGGKAPYYETYIALRKGDEGVRVRDLQTRLRALYYTAASAGGHYRENTVAAVKRFQKQMGYKQTGNITVSQLKKLGSKSCASCHIYFTLSKGDSAPVVKALNQRLKKLGYFDGSVTSNYGKSTVEAVKRFQAQYGIMATGECEPNLQTMIYDKNARHYDDPSPYEPQPKPKPGPSGQVITDAQLKVVKNWVGKFYGKSMNAKKAVGKVQDRLIDLNYMYETDRTLVYDKNTKGAILAFQNAAMPGEKHTGIAGPNTLKLLFQ